MSSPKRVPERQNIIVISTATVWEAKESVKACEHCNPTEAVIRFVWILDRVTGC
jgi:hypothetical protein